MHKSRMHQHTADHMPQCKPPSCPNWQYRANGNHFQRNPLPLWAISLSTLYFSHVLHLSRRSMLSDVHLLLSCFTVVRRFKAQELHQAARTAVACTLATHIPHRPSSLALWPAALYNMHRISILLFFFVPKSYTYLGRQRKVLRAQTLMQIKL